MSTMLADLTAPLPMPQLLFNEWCALAIMPGKVPWRLIKPKLEALLQFAGKLLLTQIAIPKASFGSAVMYS